MKKRSYFEFLIIAKDNSSKARLGQLLTPHGIIKTPNFILCGTKASLKSITPVQAFSEGIDIILSNTYHLMLSPGPELIKDHGGLHGFLNWKRPILTDSGGFQIFSLGGSNIQHLIKSKKQKNFRPNVRVTELGAYFKSHIDGYVYLLTPEKSIDIQNDLGSDFSLTFDECTRYNVDRLYTERSMNLSHRWSTRSIDRFIGNNNNHQALYGIIQGGIYPELRKMSVRFINNELFFGQAIGGSLGSDKLQMYDIISCIGDYLNRNRPTHLLGIGGSLDVWHGVEQGVDTFDCTHPTRLARHGGALVKPIFTKNKEYINLTNSRFKNSLKSIDGRCGCYCCRNFTCSYIHYLFKIKELLGGQLLTIHNVHFISKLFQLIRYSIKNQIFKEEKMKWLV